jgi:alcohol dehydrogenase (cytochrome c)
MRASTSLCLTAVFAAILQAQDVEPGRVLFENRCGRCHGADGGGGEMGPGIRNRIAGRTDEQLVNLIRNGQGSMPPIQVAPIEMEPLTRYVRSLAPRDQRPVLPREKVQTTDGKTLDGEVLNRGFEDLQLRTADHQVHLLRRVGERYREVTSGADWPGYNGDPGGNRYTTLSQITKANVAQLAPKWIFTLPNASRLQVTPVVAGGIMYVPVANECYALDAGSGREIWHYRRARTRTPGGGTNRGAAVAGDRVFMQSSDAHVLALNRFTGEVVWDTEMADARQSYFSTSAPLTVGNLVIAGTGGGEHGARGFLAAYDQATGKEVWRFWTVPLPGEPGSETWQGKGIEHGGAPTWFTGTYDAETDTLFWPTGNPSAEYYGDDRVGDNLYSDCILALDPKTGKLKWHYQSTPHDLWDWDATETPVVINAKWEGQPRKLLLHANRNGFFYVFDRTNGKLLLAKAFVRNLTWASGIGADGRPIKLPNQEPSPAGTRVCPSQDGATNWFSPSYSPATGLYYIQTFEKCSIYTKREPGAWEAGKEYLGGTQRTEPGGKPERILKAIDIQTGKISWELPQPGPAESWGGTLSTSTGLVIFGEEGGALMAADAVSGKPLWSFPTNQVWKASPMTYLFDGKQYVAVAAGASIIAFGVQP